MLKINDGKVSKKIFFVSFTLFIVSPIFAHLCSMDNKKHKTTLSTKPKNDFTQLHWAALCGSPSRVDYALKTLEIPINAQDSINLNTPLHIALLFFDRTKDNLEKLNALSKMPDITIKKEDFCQYEEVVKLLIKNGAKVDLANIEGQTPVHIAIQKDLIKPLADLCKGTNWEDSLKIKDYYDNIPYDYADEKSSANVNKQPPRRETLRLKSLRGLPKSLRGLPKSLRGLPKSPRGLLKSPRRRRAASTPSRTQRNSEKNNDD